MTTLPGNPNQKPPSPAVTQKQTANASPSAAQAINVAAPATASAPSNSEVLLTKIKEGIKLAVVKGDFEIPMLPTVATDVMKMANDPKVGIMDLERVIKQDQALAARVIKTANSPFYRGVSEISSLSNAMSRIGLKSIKDIVVSLSIQSQSFKTQGYEFILDRLWDHSVACAGISQMIAKNLGVDQESAFLSGLLHDIGKTIIVQIISKFENAERAKAEQEAKANRKPFDAKTFSIPQLKEVILPKACDEYHATIGSTVAARWNLPEIIREVVKNHHDYTKSAEAHRRLCMVVHLANMMCHQFGLGHDESPINVSQDPAWDSLGVAGDKISNMMEDGPNVAHKLMGFV